MIVGFGEVMLRLKSPGFERIMQSKSFDATFGGSECNVMVSLANYGMDTRFFTLLPDNELTEAFKKELKSFGVDPVIDYSKGRFGVYYVEAGSNQRGTKVVYDRDYTSMSMGKSVNWDKVFDKANWYHISGITPAISQSACDLTLESLEVAKNKGLTVSCDLNYRSKLWKYGVQPIKIMPLMAEKSNVIIGTEDDFNVCLGIYGDTKEICLQTMEKYNVHTVAIINVKSYSSDYKGWSATMIHNGKFYESKDYKIYDIVDGIGGGDAFSAALIYALNNLKNGEDIIEFATCGGLLKYSFFGDYNLATKEEVFSLMENNSGNINR